MNDKTLSKICLAITIIGMLLLLLTYKNEFESTTITQILKEKNSKGIISGRIEYVIKNYPITIFALTDGNRALIYYPKPTTLEKNDFVKVYAENKPEQQNNETKKSNELYAYKVIKDA
jgi:hypothetical protein